MRILLAEDDESTRKGVALFLRDEGHEVTSVPNGAEALAELRRDGRDLIISDVRMPVLDGLGLLNRLRQEGIATPVIVMTAFATVEEAVAALHAGADDYLTKPLNLDELALRIARLEARLSLQRENLRLKDRLHSIEFPLLVGGGKAMQEIHKSIARLSDSPDVPVMVYGESGTGKELVARTIHSQSRRSEHPFFDISCASLPDELLESELFGHRKGAFTGAFRDKQGILQAAHRGTLFLDEVSEMSPRMQSRLLRFLQEHTVLPVGSTTSTTVDARVVGASNRDLLAMVRAGTFREDLFYRLNVVEIHLAPLRQRPEDIPLLLSHFVEKHSGAQARRLRFSREVYDCLETHAWPGNIRELENLVRVLLVDCRDGEVRLQDLPARLRPAGAAAPARETESWQQLSYQAALHRTVAAFEEQFLRAHLARHEGNISRTAAAIGLSRVALHKKIKLYKIDV